VQGVYGRDHAAYHDYHERTRTPQGFRSWLEEWVLELPDRASYAARLGGERIRALRVKQSRLAAAVDYGY
jgi:glutaconate CoA-transferase subunit A